jgi:hypothetical protein
VACTPCGPQDYAARSAAPPKHQCIGAFWYSRLFSGSQRLARRPSRCPGPLIMCRLPTDCLPLALWRSAPRGDHFPAVQDFSSSTRPALWFGSPVLAHTRSPLAKLCSYPGPLAFLCRSTVSRPAATASSHFLRARFQWARYSRRPDSGFLGTTLTRRRLVRDSQKRGNTCAVVLPCCSPAGIARAGLQRRSSEPPVLMLVRRRDRRGHRCAWPACTAARPPP